MANPSLQPPAQPIQVDNEIDLGQLVASLVRRRRLIACVTGGTVLLTGLVTVFQKPVWEGEFQIVLSGKDNSAGGRLAQLAAANPVLAGIAGVTSGGGKESLDTQVKVLASPSVLMPAYKDYQLHTISPSGDANRLGYDAFSSNLKIKLLKNTSILNVSYRDSDSLRVIPALRAISKSYQDYSLNDRRKALSGAILFLKKQISIISPKTAVAVRQAQDYAFSNGLLIQAGGSAATQSDTEIAAEDGLTLLNPGSVEADKLLAQSQVLSLRQQVADAESSGSEVVYQAPQMKLNSELYKEYQYLNLSLSEQRSRLKDRDPIITSLKQRRSALIRTLNMETSALLRGQLSAASARLKAASRPKEVVLNHRQMVRLAVRYEKTLNELENQLQLSELEQAKQSDPWELISAPTLKGIVGPKKFRNLALGLLAGLVLGSGAALVAERRTGRIHGSDELASLLPGPLLAVLEAGEPESWRQPLQLLSSGPLAAAQTLALVPIGPEDGAAAAVAQALKAASGRPVLCSSDLVATRRCDAQVLITSPGAAERDQLHRLRRDLELQGSPVVGWLLLNDRRPRG